MLYKSGLASNFVVLNFCYYLLCYTFCCFFIALSIGVFSRLL